MLAGIAGYDLVLSISQKALNQQFQLVFPDGAGLPPWNATLANDGSQVTNVTFGTPGIDLNTPLTRGAALTLPVTGGQYTYYTVVFQDGKPVPVPKSQDLTGSVIKVTSSLSKLHDTTFHDADFTIQRIFLDLSDPHLASTFEIDVQGQALVSLTTLFAQYLAQLSQQNSSTFLFGSVKVPNVPDSVGPLAPADSDFSVYTGATDPDLNALNFLLLTAGDAPPTDAGAGDLGSVIGPGQAGAFLISGYQLISKFILPSVVAGMKQNDPSTPFSMGSFTIDPASGSASLTGNVNYDGGWFSKYNCYINNNLVTLDIEYRKEQRVIIDTVTGIGDVSAYITIYVDNGQLGYKTSQTKPSIHSDGSSTVWRVFEDIFTLGFAEIGEKVVTDAVQGAVNNLLQPGSLGPSINQAIALVEMPATTLFTYTDSSLPGYLHLDVTMKNQGPA